MKEKILVIEDDAIAKLTLTTFLQNFGYEKPFTADNALDAYDIVKKNHIDLILMDIFIRGNKDGIELAHELNKISDIDYDSQKGQIEKIYRLVFDNGVFKLSDKNEDNAVGLTFFSPKKEILPTKNTTIASPILVAKPPAKKIILIKKIQPTQSS